MPTLLYRGLGQLVKGVGFDSWRPIGAVMQTVRVFDLREVDELVFLDISATGEARAPDFELVDEIADECSMPLTVGGGIRTVEDVRRLLAVGADRIALNTMAVERPELIREVAERFGSQCVVVSIDARRSGDGRWEAVTRSGRRPTGLDVVELARRCEQLGAGEILLGSVDRDGTLQGYDLPLVASVTRAVTLPVIASGGAGSYDHLLAAVRDAGAAAVAAASMFQFTQQTPQEAKQHLRAHGVNVRL